MGVELRSVCASSALLLLLLLAASGCDSGDALELGVDVKTDFVPGVEFVGVRVELRRRPTSGGAPDRTATALASRGEAWAVGRRVAEATGLASAEYEVRVALVDAGGAEVAVRTTMLNLRGRYVLVVVIARACRGAVCPAPSDPAAATACFAGRCVDPHCSPADPAACGTPVCRSDADCPAPAAACAVARCVESGGLAVADDSTCAASEYCAPESGCVARPEANPGPADAGPPDAGSPPDAGGPPDSGAGDAGVPPPGPCLPRAPVALDYVPRAPPPLTPPARGASYLDPTFGSRIWRVTDSGTAQNAESWVPTFNADDTRMLVAEAGEATLYSLDPATGATASLGPAWAAGTHCRVDEAYWSRVDPNLLYCHDYNGGALYTWNVATRTQAMLRALTELPSGRFANQQRVDAADQVFAFLLVDGSDVGHGALVWDRATDTVYQRDFSPAEVFRVSIELGGRYVVMTRAGGWDVWDFRADTVETLVNDSTDRACSGPTGAGDGRFVSIDCYRPGYVVRRLDTPHAPTRAVDLRDAAGAQRWGGEQTFSLLHGGAQWFLATEWVDSAGDAAVYDPWEQEIVAVANDGGWVVRLAHHRSDVVAGGYSATPGAAISYDARWIAFTSNFGGPGNDVYIMRAPQACP